MIRHTLTSAPRIFDCVEAYARNFLLFAASRPADTEPRDRGMVADALPRGTSHDNDRRPRRSSMEEFGMLGLLFRGSTPAHGRTETVRGIVTRGDVVRSTDLAAA